MSEGGNAEDGEDVEDLGEDVDWQYHPLKQFLKDKIIDGSIPCDWKLMKPFDVWNTYCDNDVFEGMEYDAAFKRRLLSLRNQVKVGKNRAADDQKAFEIAKTKHPPPALNHWGEPQWNGSAAQALLEEALKNKRHEELEPQELWESKPEYQEFRLSTFRDHIYQAVGTKKYLYQLDLKAKAKEEERKAKAKKKKESKE